MKLKSLLEISPKKEILKESLESQKAAEAFVRSMIENYNKIHNITLPVSNSEYQSLTKELQSIIEASFQDGFAHGMKQGVGK
jgi:hypothetical protein